MDKESIYELQKIDCNCNDCIFMIRDIEKYKEWQEKRLKQQLDDYNLRKSKIAEPNVNKKQFQYEKSSINYGNCTKFNKDVTFIPNHCQPENRDCFKHRKDQENPLIGEIKIILNENSDNMIWFKIPIKGKIKKIPNISVKF